MVKALTRNLKKKYYLRRQELLMKKERAAFSLWQEAFLGILGEIFQRGLRSIFER